MIVDGHEDLALNALFHGRDYLTSAGAIRAAEVGSSVEEVAGRCMLGLAEWLEAQIGVVVGTIATIPREFALLGETTYANPDEAHQQALAQLNLYRRWQENSEQIVLVRNRPQLDEVLSTWTDADADVRTRRIGIVLLIENADPIRHPEEVVFWAEQGVRMIGPAWHSNRFCGDTREGGPLTALGRRLLKAMGSAGLVLDVTHMSEEACLNALDSYEGAVVATHAHSRRTVPIERLLSDRVIEGIVARHGIIGVMPLNWALAEGWRRTDGKTVTLEAVVDAIDVICQIAGDARHVGLGTDFDGGQGAESAPAEIDTIGDLPKLAAVLATRGFPQADIDGVMADNWLRLLGQRLP